MIYFGNPEYTWGIKVGYSYVTVHGYATETEARKQLVFANMDVFAQLVEKVNNEWELRE